MRISSLGAGEATAALTQREDVSNHIGSVHAGALFTLGETASGAAMSGAFAARIAAIRPIATGAAITYQRIAKGEVVARAAIKNAEDLISRLDADGRVAIDVGVVLEDGTGATVATMTVGWLVTAR